MKASVVTLGCKVNEYESQSILNQLKSNGYEITEGLVPADVYVLNTCAVTNEGERKSRQTLTKVLKINPNAKVIVCGCAAQNNPGQFLVNPNVFAIAGNFGKNDIMRFINKRNTEILPFNKEYSHFMQPISTRARQYIKIQDGCNYFCTYCLIPYLRGRSVSRPLKDIIEEIKNVQVNEIVLTGINMSDYKINGKLALKKLVKEVDKLNVRFRLSSLECNVLDDEFIEILSKSKNFCPHFHLSLQSACNATLKRMNRHYTIQQFTDIVAKLRKTFKDPFIATDVIVGFKGEIDKEFEQTYKNLKKLKFQFMHIFPYSVRSGTMAEKLSDDVDKQIVKQRIKMLEEINKENVEEYLTINTNTKHKMLVEEIDGEVSMGYTENYIYCYIPKKLAVGSIVDVVLEKPFKKGMKAKLN